MSRRDVGLVTKHRWLDDTTFLPPPSALGFHLQIVRKNLTN